jgi:3-oxoacyl-[acyl-carrier protein] reductase
MREPSQTAPTPGITGRLAVVTGAAKGIGAGISTALAIAGARVAIVDLDSNAASELATKLTGDHAAQTLPIVCDVSSSVEVTRAAREIGERLGPVDLLVNNAGIGDFVSFPQITRRRWDRMIEIHLTGAYNWSHAVLPTMVARKSGRVVNISSVAGKRGDFIGNAHYTAAKAGLIGLTKSLAGWAAPHGVRVNAIAPGLVDTDLTRAMNDEHKAATMARIPLGRFAAIEEIAAVVLFLLSDASGYIVGETINVNGGSYLD